jgi:hypothetical protein
MNFDEDSRAASDLGEDGEFEHGISGAHPGERDRAVVIRSSLAVLLQPNAETGRPYIRSHEDNESRLRYAADTGNDGARLRPSVTGIVSRFIFFLADKLEWWRVRSGVRGSGGVRGSELDAVVECVREIEGMDMDGEEGGELEQGESAHGMLGEVARHAPVEPSSKREISCGCCGGAGSSIPFAPVGMEERDWERRCI